jgi:AcrR family transcriptional regulator
VEQSVSDQEPTRKRRASGEVERLIIGAAAEVFAEKGYAGATTREIAARAEVHEPMVYRRFGSKSELFVATVFAPMNVLISQYLETYSQLPADPSTDLEELVTHFIEPFYDLVRGQRRLLLALLAAWEFDEDFADDGQLRLTGLTRLDHQLELAVSSRGLVGIDIPAANRVALAMIMGVALIGDWLESEPGAVDRERLISEMAKMSIHGITRQRADDVSGQATSVTPEEFEALLDRVADAERRAVRAELELSILRNRSQPAAPA